MSTPFDTQRERYLSLATFRRDGREVRTPVWFAEDPAEAGLLWIYTNGQSGKVKRVRANGRARVAACDVRGKLRGEFGDATASIVTDAAEAERGWAALRRKYGWQLAAVLLGSRIGGTFRHRTLLAVRTRAGA